jgi:hypothetical protein
MKELDGWNSVAAFGCFRVVISPTYVRVEDLEKVAG